MISRMIRFYSTYKFLSHLGKHYFNEPLSYISTSEKSLKMAILNTLSFSTLVVLAKAAYLDIGPCPPLPDVVPSFDVERVNMAS